MELAKGILKTLLDYLIAHGYPQNTFAVEYQIGQFRVDLAIIDPETNIPIQIFEIKPDKNEHSRSLGRKQLENFLTELKQNIPAYLVFPKESEPYFEIEPYQVKGDFSPYAFDHDQDSYINFIYQKQSRFQENIKDLKDKKVRRVKSFQVVCWIIAGLLLLFLIMSKTGLICVKLDLYELIIIGSIVLLILLPFTESIKIFNLEIRLLKEKQKGNRK